MTSNPHTPSNLRSYLRLNHDSFWSKVEKTTGGCWIWTGRTDSNGYGRVDLGPRGKQALAHRISAVCKFGDAIAGKNVCHRCDTPSCVNPNHFFLGTQADNMRDMFRKGRHHKRRPTHCKHGHELKTRRSVTKMHRTYCPECTLKYTRLRRARIKAQQEWDDHGGRD